MTTVHELINKFDVLPDDYEPITFSDKIYQTNDIGHALSIAYGIQLTHYEYPGRAGRLESVLATFLMDYPLAGMYCFGRMIEAIHDHKGCLCIKLKVDLKPNTIEFNMVMFDLFTIFCQIWKDHYECPSTVFIYTNDEVYEYDKMDKECNVTSISNASYIGRKFRDNIRYDLEKEWAKGLWN